MAQGPPALAPRATSPQLLLRPRVPALLPRAAGAGAEALADVGIAVQHGRDTAVGGKTQVRAAAERESESIGDH